MVSKLVLFIVNRVHFTKRQQWNVAFVFEVHEMFNLVASDRARLLALFKAKKCRQKFDL